MLLAPELAPGRVELDGAIGEPELLPVPIPPAPGVLGLAGEEPGVTPPGVVVTPPGVVVAPGVLTPPGVVVTPPGVVVTPPGVAVAPVEPGALLLLVTSGLIPLPPTGGGAPASGRTVVVVVDEVDCGGIFLLVGSANGPLPVSFGVGALEGGFGATKLGVPSFRSGAFAPNGLR